METLRAKPKPLALLNANPEQLIPDSLVQQLPAGSVVFATPFQISLGRFNHEYDPPLSFLVAQRGNFNVTANSDCGETWEKTLNLHRARAISSGDLSEHDRVLLSCIAGDFNTFGVNIRAMILTKDIRRNGIGSSFLQSLSAASEDLGYQYLFGRASSFSPFAIRNGFLSWEELNENRDRYLKDVDGVARMDGKGDGITVVKFLDPELERLCLN